MFVRREEFLSLRECERKEKTKKSLAYMHLGEGKSPRCEISCPVSISPLLLDTREKAEHVLLLRGTFCAAHKHRLRKEKRERRQRSAFGQSESGAFAMRNAEHGPYRGSVISPFFQSKVLLLLLPASIPAPHARFGGLNGSRATMLRAELVCDENAEHGLNTESTISPSSLSPQDAVVVISLIAPLRRTTI